MKKIFLDFDDTMAESSKCMINLINKIYNCNKTQEDLKDYGFQSIYPISEKEKLELFESDDFFKNLKLKEGVLDFINTYYKKYKIIISTKGTYKNLIKKEKWIKDIFGDKIIFMGLNGNSHDKSYVDMKDSIEIEDNASCLNTNAKIKILYKSFNNFPWQQVECSKDIIIVNTWEDICQILDFYEKYDYKDLEEKDKKHEKNYFN